MLLIAAVLLFLTGGVRAVIAGAASAVLPLVLTRGRHLSWVVFLLVAALTCFAA